MEKKFVPALSIGKVLNDNLSDENKFMPGRLITGDEAYDAYHLHLYFKEILNTKLHFNELIRADRNEFLKTIIEYSIHKKNDLAICELGSSLMEIIDGFDHIKNNFFNKFDNNVNFFGIEKSSFLAESSSLLHPNKEIKIWENFKEVDFNLINKNNNISILVDRAVSSYAFSNIDEYINFINNFDISFLQIFGFIDEEKIVQDTIGTELLYFNLSELFDKLDNFYHMYGTSRPTRPESLLKNKKCIEGFFLNFKDAHLAKEFFLTFKSSNSFINYYKEKIVNESFNNNSIKNLKNLFY